MSTKNMKKSWSLEDADELASKHKYTFYKPSAALIEKVQPGEAVELIFKFEPQDSSAPNAERMWVNVVSRAADGSFIGTLDNDPFWIHDLHHGDEIKFAAKHIISTEHEEESPHRLYSQRCFVSNRLLNDGDKVGMLYREDPEADLENDSGWRFMSMTDVDQVDQTPELSYISVGAMLALDDSYLDLLGSPVGAVFMLNESTGKFEQSFDPSTPE